MKIEAITAPNVDEPSSFARVPGFSGIEVRYRCYEEDPAEIEYCGTAEELIAAGIVTADMLETNRRTGPRRRRIDKDGDPFRLLRYWRSTKGASECAPYRYFRLTFLKPHTRLGKLTGVQDAIAAYERWIKWDAERRSAQVHEMAEVARGTLH
jgi:hypothetical protein